MKIVKSASLYYREGASDKVYQAQLAEVPGGYVVNFQYGRRGSALKADTKTNSPLPKEQALKVYDKLVASKEAKGYTSAETGETFTATEYKSQKTTILPQLLNAIEDDGLDALLNNDLYLAQEKFDGERRLVQKSTNVIGINKKGLVVALPQVIEDSIKAEMIIDGEIIGGVIYAFDILELRGVDTKKMSTLERVKLLESQSFGKNIKVAESALTTKEKKVLLQKLKDKNAEGIVFKKISAKYTPGRPASGGAMLKFKFYKTASFVVTAHSKSKRSVEISLIDNGKNVSLGNVAIPSNQNFPVVGSIVEVRYLTNRGGAVIQPVYLGERSDVDESEAVVSQLVYKQAD